MSATHKKLFLISNRNGLFVTTSHQVATEAETNGEDVDTVEFVGTHGGQDFYGCDRTRYGSGRSVIGHYIDLYKVSMYLHDPASGEAEHVGEHNDFAEYLSELLDS